MPDREALIAAAREAMTKAYAPYSNFHVGAALRFDDDTIITGTNVENASYGLSLCAETVAAARAMAEGRRGGLVEIAVTGTGPAPVTPCGRCRQVLNELAELGGTDPVVWSCGAEEVREYRLSELLPASFGPSSLNG